jgi:hypothetical protein
MSGSGDLNCRLSEAKLSYSLVERKTKVSECFYPANRQVGNQERQHLSFCLLAVSGDAAVVLYDGSHNFFEKIV